MRIFNYIKEYGIILKILPTFYSKTKNFDKMHDFYLKYIQKHYGYIFEKYKSSNFITEKSEKSTDKVWVLWWQGEENMPQVVKLCLESVKKHTSGREVIVLNEKNYDKYVNIPDYIVKKYKKGIIGHAHMSDVLRTFLLREYGGTWIDATMFVSSPFEEVVKGYDFYTINVYRKESACITKGKWVISFMHVGCTHTVIFELLKDLYQACWKEHNVALTYLFMDYFIKFAYESIPSIKEEIDKIPLNNYGFHDLIKNIDCPFDEGKWNEIKERAFLHKLSWKSDKYEEAKKSDTFYKRILDGKLE